MSKQSGVVKVAEAIRGVMPQNARVHLSYSDYQELAQAAVDALELTQETKTRRVEVSGGPELVQMSRLIGPWGVQ